MFSKILIFKYGDMPVITVAEFPGVISSVEITPADPHSSEAFRHVPIIIIIHKEASIVINEEI